MQVQAPKRRGFYNFLQTWKGQIAQYHSLKSNANLPLDHPMDLTLNHPESSSRWSPQDPKQNYWKKSNRNCYRYTTGMLRIPAASVNANSSSIRQQHQMWSYSSVDYHSFMQPWLHRTWDFVGATDTTSGTAVVTPSCTAFVWATVTTSGTPVVTLHVQPLQEIVFS